LAGEVKRPAIYESLPTESLSDVIKYAGGFSPNAFREQVTLERVNNNRLREATTLDLTQTVNINTRVRDGDFMLMPSIAEKIDNAIELIGAVSRPGIFQWKQGIRVSDLINDLSVDLRLSTDLDYALIVREKNQRRDVSVQQFDLAGALTHKQTASDPLLNPRDKIIVFDREINSTLNRRKLLMPVINKLKFQARMESPLELIDISGAVRYPGTYPYFKGMRVRDLVSASGGLLDSAYRPTAEVSRVDLSNLEAANITLVNISLDKALNGVEEADIELQIRDRLQIRPIPDWQENQTITLKGEFLFPGVYSFRKGETLSSLIKRAGGLTRYADSRASIFMREEIKKLEAERIKQVREQLSAQLASDTLTDDTTLTAGSGSVKVAPGGKNLSPQQTKTLLDQLDKTTAMGRLIIDLQGVIENPKQNDIEVEGGDTLVVLTRRNSVSVLGEVMSPTTHVFNDYLSKNDYVARSGGMTKQADDERIYIIRPNGAVAPKGESGWLFGEDSEELTPGDTIVVPLDTEYMAALPMWTSITQIIYQSAVALAAIASL
jgi:protein involved in polysaccharide export with SLBB domain